jgi:hypothetical protein
MDRVTRRGVVVAGAAAVLTACSDTSSSPETTPATRRTASATTSPTTTSPSPSSPTTRSSAPPDLPAVTRWQPDPNDIEPACKLAAVRRVEAAGNEGDRALEVIDAQYGGLLTDTASVLVVSRSWTTRGGRIVPGGHTFDVRLSRTPGEWRVTSVRPSRPGEPAASLTTAARRVLASDRIHLPPAGRLDVGSGTIHDSVLRALLDLSATYRIDVSVVRSGHPILVFGTDRPSDHPQGRAFDTWAIDAKPVVDARTPRSLVEDYMHAAAAAGSYNVGGPYLLGSAPQFFSDDTHHDHVHAGFTT